MDWDWGSHGPLNTYEKDEEEDAELEQGTSNKIWIEDKREVIRIRLYSSNERMNTTG
jgi:hypothetical protein